MFSVIIVMAGKGTRTGLSLNKALAIVGGKPLFMHSYEIFKEMNAQIVLVARNEDIPEIKKYVDNDTIITTGGSTRAHSVYNGLLKCKNEKVLIHDAARPFITKELVNDVLNMLDTHKASYVGIKVKDTIRDISTNHVVDRNNLIAAQTPQGAYLEDLKGAYELSFKMGFEATDDISVLEKYSNVQVGLVQGSEMNFKITTPYDLQLANIIMKEANNND